MDMYQKTLNEIDCILALLAENQSSRRASFSQNQRLYVLFKEKVRMAVIYKQANTKKLID